MRLASRWGGMTPRRGGFPVVRQARRGGAPTARARLSASCMARHNPCPCVTLQTSLMPWTFPQAPGYPPKAVASGKSRTGQIHININNLKTSFLDYIKFMLKAIRISNLSKQLVFNVFMIIRMFPALKRSQMVLQAHPEVAPQRPGSAPQRPGSAPRTLRSGDERGRLGGGL